jgi:hypothetical protein
VVAYLLAAVCFLVPLALVGAVFAGIVLMRRNRQADGVSVLVIAAVATAAGLLLLH